MAKAPVNPFAAAAAGASAPKPPAGKKTADFVLVKDPEVAAAIDSFCEADAKAKQFESDKDVAKGVAVPFCRTEFLKRFAEAGRQPENSIKFRTEASNSVTFVVQDRGEKYEVSAEQLETLRAILGDEKVEKVLLRDMTFSFDNSILNRPGVMEALGAKIGELVTDGVLSEAESAALLVANSRTTVRKGTLGDLARLCENNPDTMESLLAALGSHATAYIKS